MEGGSSNGILDTGGIDKLDISSSEVGQLESGIRAYSHPYKCKFFAYNGQIFSYDL